MNRSMRSTLVALAAASVLAFLEVFRRVASQVLYGETVGIPELVHGVLPMWMTVVLVSPWCAFMARRFPFRPGHLGRTLLAHLGGAAVFVALQMTLMITVHRLFGGAQIFPWTGLLHRYVFYIAIEMSLYGAIVLVVLLLDAREDATERALAAARLEQGLTAARLESLRAQLQPHFLFNTLNALAVLARKGDGDAVDRAIGDLGELLRASFDTSGRREIPLREELDFLERYLHLQRIRFPDRLEVAWRIEPETRNALVPPLVVQPLVENALEHGLSTARGGHVGVSARRDGDVLELEVLDEGPGFNGEAARAGGVGLAHTRERLTLLYGPRGTLACTDRPGGGGVVRIRIPWREPTAGRDAS